MARRTRFAAAFLAIFAMLFAQLAVSAFACPLDLQATAPMSMDGEHCDKVFTPNLCDRHCDYGAASVNHAAPDVAPDVLALPLPWRATFAPAPAAFAPAAIDVASRSHSPPPLALLGFLRI